MLHGIAGDVPGENKWGILGHNEHPSQMTNE